MKKILLVFSLISTLASCQNEGQKNVSKSQNTFSLKEINLEDYKPKKIADVPQIEHKLFEKIKQVDTLFIAKNIKCIKKSTILIPAKDEFSNEKILSVESIYYKDKLIFSLDSVITVSMFDYMKDNSQITFVNFKDQNPDNFETTSDLYYINMEKSRTEIIKSNITNTTNAPFSLSGKYIIYFDNNVLNKFNLESKSQESILKITNNYIPYFIKIINSKSITLAFFKDISEGQLYKTTIIFEEDVFE